LIKRIFFAAEMRCFFALASFVGDIITPDFTPDFTWSASLVPGGNDASTLDARRLPTVGRDVSIWGLI
jgi:hypothetical protein